MKKEVQFSIILIVFLLLLIINLQFSIILSLILILSIILRNTLVEKVAFVTWYNIHPPNTGGKIKTYQVFNHISLNKILISSSKKGKRTFDLSFIYKKILHIIDPVFIITALFHLLKEHPKIIVSETNWSMTPCILASLLLGSKLLFNTHNLEYTMYSRLKKKNKLVSMLLLMLERIFCHFSDNILVCSNIEKKELIKRQKINPNKIYILPNGIEISKKKVVNHESNVLFIGKLDYKPNKEALNIIINKISPALLEKSKNTKIYVVGGPKPSSKISNVVFTGFVKDIKPFFIKSCIGIAPLFSGSGTRIKILEYASNGLAVVSTSVGCEGIDLKGIFVENDINKFVNKILLLLKDSKLRNDSGRKFFKSVKKYDWGLISKDFNMYLRSLL